LNILLLLVVVAVAATTMVAEAVLVDYLLPVDMLLLLGLLIQ
jgi:hypothetical protein